MKTKHTNAIILVTRNVKTGMRLACVFHDTHAGWDGPNPIYDLTDSSLHRIERIADTKRTNRDGDIIETTYE